MRSLCAATLATVMLTNPLLMAQAQAQTPAPADAATRGDTTIKPTTPEDAVAGRNRGKFSFEFAKAEIVDVVKAVSDMTRYNFIIPEKVKGQKITILSPTKISASEAYQVFYTALAANGISLVRSGRFYKLVDAKDAMRETVPTCLEGEKDCNLFSEQMVTVLMRLRYSDVSQVSTVAKSLLSRDGDVTVFAPSNALIISEYAPNLRRVRRILESLDVAGGDDDLQLVHIQYATPSEIAEKLTQVFELQPANAPRRQAGQPGGLAQGLGQVGGDGSSDVQISKIVPDDRTSQIILKANRRSFGAIKNLITKLDVPISDSEHGRVHVHFLENAKAEEMASTLSSLAAGQPTSQKNARPGSPGGPQGGGGRSPGAVETASLFEGEVKITADKTTNSLLVVCSARDWRAVRNLIEKLDVSRRQVYVEAAIMEVTVKDKEDVGFQWHAPIPGQDFDGASKGKNLGFLQNSATSSGPSPTLQAYYNIAGFLSAASGTLGGFFGKPVTLNINNTNVPVPSFGVLLKWLETTSNANVLSTPHILTTDNEQASIEVGEKIPFASGLFGGQSGAAGGIGSALTGGGGAGALGGLSALSGLGGLGNSVQRIDVSLKLAVTPQINERNKIRLEIDQNIEDVTSMDQRTNSFTTAHRALKTVVVVDDQQPVVLGGLMRDRSTDSEVKIPLLGDIPVIGFLFKQRNTDIQKVNLVLVLTPYIISSPSDFQRILERKLEEHEEFQAEYYGHRKEYRAFIDYNKKTGPLSRLVATVRRENDRIENGGAGDGQRQPGGAAAAKK